MQEALEMLENSRLVQQSPREAAPVGTAGDGMPERLGHEACLFL